jgi:REP-associated tyrosine transposase
MRPIKMAPRARRDPQRSLALPQWGGARRGAGRKPSTGAQTTQRRNVPHRAREVITRHTPVHVTLRMRHHVWNLRSRRSFDVVSSALAAGSLRRDFRVVHFGVEGNHLHLIAEADAPSALARGLNRMMGTRGPVLAGRYHAHVLRTPAEVRRAVRYVVGNHASHARRRGAPVGDAYVDPYASDAPREAAAQRSLWPSSISRPARSWLLRRGRPVM